MRSAALMAQNHNTQNTLSRPPAKALLHSAAESAAPLRAARSPSSLALFALGTNAWLTCVGWVLISNDVAVWHTAAASFALVPLWLGAVLHARTPPEHRSDSARWLLLCVFPVALAAALCLGSEATREQAHSPWSLLLAAASLLAYGAAALQACRTPLAILPTRSQARRSERGAAPARESAAMRAGAALLWIGAFAIAIIAPLSSDYATLQLAWGDAADAGAAFTAVVAGGIAVGLLGTELGPLLKARRARYVSTRTRRNRIAVMLFLTLCGGMMYLGVLR
jgi:hypothetical protein